MIENVLTNGGVAIIDEPDAYLHPLMLKSLITRFSNSRINTGGGQIIFSTHNIYVLDFLKKYEINLVDKKDAVTQVRRLDTIPGVRNTDNFVKKYFDREYDGLPQFD
jgi:AAA15 family ATPase/GTPase